MRVVEYWRGQRARYELVGEKCPHCDEKIFPPRDICPNRSCGKDTFTLPLTTSAERKYYGEKGVILNENIRSTRVNMAEIFEN